MPPLLQAEGILRCNSPLEGYSIWAVTDGTAGPAARAQGVAEALGLDVDPRLLANGSVVSAAKRSRAISKRSPWPDIAIGAGRGIVPYLKSLRRASEGATFTVLLQHTRAEPDAADIVWSLPNSQTHAANLITTLTTPHVMGQHQFLAFRASPASESVAIRRPVAAVLLGGPDHGIIFGPDVLGRFAACLMHFAKRGFGFLVSPSARTSNALLQAVTDATASSQRIIWTGTGPNPYWSFLAHADCVIVTGDSVNMTSEACVTGKPIYVFDPGAGAAATQRFHAHLRKYGATRPLTADVDPSDTWTYAPLDSAPYIANEITRKFTALRQGPGADEPYLGT